MIEILGLDVSLSGTGLCKCNAESEDFVISHLQTIKTTTHTKSKGVVTKIFEDQERYEIILKVLNQQGLRNENTIFVAIEDYAFGAFGQAMTKLAELQGIIRQCLYEDKKGWCLIASTMEKKWVSGKGNTKKIMMPMHTRQKYANEIMAWGIELVDDNVADAIGMCHIAYCHYRWSRNLPLNYHLSKDDLKALEKLSETNMLKINR